MSVETNYLYYGPAVLVVDGRACDVHARISAWLRIRVAARSRSELGLGSQQAAVTKVPRPCTTVTLSCLASSATARRMVIRLTP